MTGLLILFGILVMLAAVSAVWLDIKASEKRRAQLPVKKEKEEEIEDEDDDEDLGQGPFYGLLKTWNSDWADCRVCVFNRLRCFCYVLSDENLLVEALCPRWTYPPGKFNKPEFLKSFEGIADVNLPDTLTEKQRKRKIKADRQRSLAGKTIYCSTYFHGKLKRVPNKKEKLKKFRSTTLSALIAEIQAEIDSRLALENL